MPTTDAPDRQDKVNRATRNWPFSCVDRGRYFLPPLAVERPILKRPFCIGLPAFFIIAGNGRRSF